MNHHLLIHFYYGKMFPVVFTLTKLKNRRSNGHTACQWYCIFPSPKIDFPNSKPKDTGVEIISHLSSTSLSFLLWLLLHRVQSILATWYLTSAVTWWHQILYRSPVDSNKWPPNLAHTLKYHLWASAKLLFDSRRAGIRLESVVTDAT